LVISGGATERAAGTAALLARQCGDGVSLCCHPSPALRLSLLVSATLITALSVSRRAIDRLGACALPLASRFYSFCKKGEASVFLIRVTIQLSGARRFGTTAFHRLTSNRAPAVGVGMDSIQVALARVGLFDNGRMPMATCILTICRSRSSAACRL